MKTVTKSQEKLQFQLPRLTFYVPIKLEYEQS